MVKHKFDEKDRLAMRRLAFGDRLTYILTRLGTTKREFATVSGIDTSNLSTYTLGKVFPGYLCLLSLMETLKDYGITWADLMGMDGGEADG